MRKNIQYFALGFLCFLISQPLLRLPLLNKFQHTTGFSLAYLTCPVLVGVLIALTAGIFEETFRFLFKHLFMKPDKCEFGQPIIFGLGHGISEVCFILLPAISLISIDQLPLALFERVLAVIFHMAVTIVVWNGFQRNKKVILLLLAIILHGMMDALIPVILSVTASLFVLYGAFLAADILMVIYACHSRRYYLKEEVQ